MTASTTASATLTVVLLVAVAMSGTSATCLSRRHLSQYDPMNDPNWPNRYANQDPSNATSFGSWQPARATAAYNHDGMDINMAACAFGNVDPNSWGGQGLQVAAISDVNPEYTSSCGRCYEFQCANRDFSDAYGATLYRSSACASTSGSMVVKIIDSCPCHYPSNYYSNKRWCCGDMTHFDLSYWAFQKFANPSNGVIAINYRRVPCTHKPEQNLGPIGYPSGWPSSSWYPTTYGDQAVFPSSADQPLPSPSPSPSPAPDAAASAAASASGGSATAVASASTSSSDASASTGPSQQPTNSPTASPPPPPPAVDQPTQSPTPSPTTDSQPAASSPPPPPPPPASDHAPGWSPDWSSDWSSPTPSPSPSSWSSPSPSPDWSTSTSSSPSSAASSSSPSSTGSPGQQASCDGSSCTSAWSSPSTSSYSSNTGAAASSAASSSSSSSSSSAGATASYIGRRRMASATPASTPT